MTTSPSPRREADHEEDDWTSTRRPIQGDEVRVGVGKYNVTLRGGIVIIVVLGLAVLALVAVVAQRQRDSEAIMAAEHRQMTATVNQALRLQTCVLSMTPDELLQWRGSRDAQNALIMFCPGLLVSAP